jgi:hypothetical protein
MFGPPKIGKTRILLNLVKRGDYVAMISTDHGTLEIYRNPSEYQGRLIAAEVYTLQDMRKALEEGKTTVRKLIQNGIPAHKIWVCIDTLTHLQITLLTEARRISLKNPDSKNDHDEYVRDITTQADWGINLGLMSECANMINSYPCNIVSTSLERESRTTRRPEPSISGQSRDRFLGDADVILRIVCDQDNKRKFHTSVLAGAGDRSGVLDEIEEPDLMVIRDKIFGKQIEKGQDNGNQATETDK